MASYLMTIISEMASSAGILANVTAVAMGAAGVYFLREYFAGGVCTSQARMDGKTVVITGCNTGIGLETARDLSNRGARVIMACRNIDAANKAAEAIKSETGNSLAVYNLDLSSLRSVRECAEKLVANEQRIDVLINNAGVAACPHSRTEDDFEMQMGTNHLGHFLFTNLLLPKLIASQPSRIVTVSSRSHIRVKGLDLDDLNWRERQYNGIAAYGESKLANVLFSRELGKRLSLNEATKRVTTYSLHPGVVRTEVFRHLEKWIGPLKYPIWVLAWPFIKTSSEGAQTSIYCAVDESLANETGKYYVDCRETETAPHGADDEMAEKLWKISEKLVGL